MSFLAKRRFSECFLGGRSPRDQEQRCFASLNMTTLFMRWPLRFRRLSTVQLLIALALLFTCAPFVEEIKGGDLVVSFLLSLVLLSGVFAVADRKYVLVVAIALAIPAIARRWINHFRPDLVPPSFFLSAALVLPPFVVMN